MCNYLAIYSNGLRREISHSIYCFYHFRVISNWFGVDLLLLSQMACWKLALRSAWFNFMYFNSQCFLLVLVDYYQLMFTCKCMFCTSVKFHLIFIKLYWLVWDIVYSCFSFHNLCEICCNFVSSCETSIARLFHSSWYSNCLEVDAISLQEEAFSEIWIDLSVTCLTPYQETVLLIL